MTPDERALLTNFLRDLIAVRGGPKDIEADSLIGQALAANPDAAYLLVQHAIVADQALHSAQARIAELEAQAPVAPPPSFLPAASNPWGGPPSPVASPWGNAGYAPPPPEQRPSIFGGSGGLGSFLRSAGTTAAGVAGGEMLFGGLSDLFGGHHERGLFGGGDSEPRENVVINNYNDSDDGDDDSSDDN